MWEVIDDRTHRMKVPGGWIVRSRYLSLSGGASVHQIFISDPYNEWELPKETR